MDDVCFECANPANEQHHVIPKIRGGTKTVPLCFSCHGKVHDQKRNLPVSFSDLIKEGLRKARARGQRLGGIKKYDDQVIAIVLNLHSQTKTYAEIGRLMNMPWSTVRAIVERESCRISK